MRDRTIDEAVDEQIRQRPESVAVVHGAQRVTYRELGLMAGACARDLAKLGVGPGSLVPVRMRRSVDVIAVMLGILWLGAAYTVVDIDWPAERVHELLEQLSASLLVGEQLEQREPAARRPVFSWSPPGPHAAETDTPAGGGGDPGAPYAVFFTSGTTGRPKGALLSHRGILRLFADGSPLDLGPGTVLTQGGALPWDLAALEIWGALVNGGTLVLADDRFLTGPGVRRLVETDGVNTVALPTSVFRMIAEEDAGCFAGLSSVLVGGEALPSWHCSRFFAAAPGVKLVNLYGPIECSVLATAWQVSPADCAADAGIPIGVPAPMTELHLAAGGRECEPGELGEILVGGPGLAIRYLGEPAASSEKFGWHEIGGIRRWLYRTGDLAVRDDRGVLYFKGRADRQVKVRGLRVEPAAVEAISGRIAGVRACVVLPRLNEDGSCDSLVAFYVTDSGLTAQGLRQQVARQIASHQVPGEFVQVGEIPLTSNGKVDHAALFAAAAPARSTDRSAGDAGHAGKELGVRGIVADCLGVPMAAVEDSVALADLGACSLDLTRIAARIGASIGTAVPLSAMFECRSVGDIADWLRARESTGNRPEATGARPTMTPTQAYFMADHFRDGTSIDHNCVFAWSVEGAVDTAALTQTLSALHDRYESFRARYTFQRGPRVIVGTGTAPEVLARRVADAGTALSVLHELSRRGLTPREGTVWFPFIIEIANGARTLFGMVAHHVAIDGNCSRILARDIADIYYQVTCGVDAPSLAPSPTVREIAAVSREALGAVDLGAERGYWRRQLEGLPAMPLPRGDGEPGAAPGRVGAELGQALHGAVVRASRRLGVTPFAIYLSAYAQALASLTGTADIGVLTPVDQRSDHRIRDAVGCLISIVCLRVKTAPGAPLADTARLLAGVIRQAFSAQDASVFGDYLSASEAARAPDVFRNMFVLQDTLYSEIPLRNERASLFVPPYAGLPVDVLTEVVPRFDGSAALYVNHRTGAVSREFCQRLADAVIQYLREQCGPVRDD